MKRNPIYCTKCGSNYDLFIDEYSQITNPEVMCECIKKHLVKLVNDLLLEIKE